MVADLGACAGSRMPVNEEPAETAGLIAKILKSPADYESKIVTVSGFFSGWRGPCRGGPPVSRSDWMIADSWHCIYVHGPVPSGLDPAKPTGETITVTGTIRIKRGHPYLEMGN